VITLETIGYLAKHEKRGSQGKLLAILNKTPDIEIEKRVH
jgi:hypothetical protein